MSDGWIKVHRSIRDNWVWSDAEYLRAWLDLLMMANWKDNKRLYKGVLITQKRGQVITTIRNLAERWGWSTGKVKRYLDMLETDHMLTQKRTTNGTTLTIENYAFYQDERPTDDTTDGSQIAPLTAHSRPTTEERKKLKESIKKAEEEAGPPSQEEVDRRLAALRARRDQVNKEWRNTEA